jgi:hypothetical protein
MQTYLDGVSRAEAKVTALENQRKVSEEAHASALKAIDDKIAAAQKLLVRITGESSEA